MIYCVEDDDSIRELMLYALRASGFEAEGFRDSVGLFDALSRSQPQLIMLDIMLPGMDGIEILKALRGNPATARIPVIIASARGTEYDKVVGLDAGADEFIPKGSPEVLIAHMKRLRDRIKGCMNIPHLYQLSKHTTYNSITREVTIDGITKRLPKNEGRFLQLLCAKNHEIADKSYLIIGTWGKADKNKEPEVKKYISRLRGYLKADPSLQIDHEGDGYILICLAD